MGRHVELVEADLAPCAHKVVVNRLDVRLPHVHGDCLDGLPLFWRKTLKESIEALLPSFEENVQDRTVQVTNHGEVVVPLPVGHFVDSQPGSRLLLAASETSLDGTALDSSDGVPPNVKDPSGSLDARFEQAAK